MKRIESSSLGILIDLLKAEGYTTIAPKLREGVILYDEIESAADLPAGYTDIQEKASYQVTTFNKPEYFHYTSGPYAWKKFLFPEKIKLWDAKKNGKDFEIIPTPENKTKYAFIGVRSCDLSAIRIQDKVFNHGEYIDSAYSKLRENCFIVAVNCSKANPTCFCVSQNTGPKAKSGFDLSLTEIFEDDDHFFLIETGSSKGDSILSKLQSKEASDKEIETAARIINETEKTIHRSIDNYGIKELLYSSFDNPYWDEIAKRCLTCANCTLVCPTCFCNTVEDITDLSGEHAERWRKWDSCFTLDFAKVAGGTFRQSAKARYRQWMTHKLASWFDQFGTSGCVGCGRCITWCPVGIDITEEASVFKKIKLENKPQN
jgi:ferredoxin